MTKDEAIQKACEALGILAIQVTNHPDGHHKQFESASELAIEALHALRTATDWRPIAEAPKDGALVLLWWEYWSHRPLIGRWSQLILGHWESDGASSSEGPGPTHYMPLPAPPSQADEAKEAESAG